MKKEIISDKDYIEAFNQGYELSKELGLKSDILNDLVAGNNRMEAMKDGMEQYAKEVAIEKGIIPPLDLDNLDITSYDGNIPDKSKDRDKGIDIDL